MKEETKYFLDWQGRKESGNRSSSQEYLLRKAKEHAIFMEEEDKGKRILDLATGAGELLNHLAEELNICTAVDFSQSMIDSARERLSHKEINLICSDWDDYVSSSTEGVWLTTGGLNQYLSLTELERLCSDFKNNQNASSFYLFDCIDPLRFYCRGLGSKFDSVNEKNGKIPMLMKKIYYLSLFLYTFFYTSMFSTQYKFKDNHFGYGYTPNTWVALAKKYEFKIRIASSANFEYRYHVMLLK